MPKRQRTRCVACVAYHKPYPQDCEFRPFFPNSTEIDYSNFFKVVKGAAALRALLNEPVHGRHKTDAEKLTVIRAILIEGNIIQQYPVQRAAGIIYTLQKQLASQESQMPGTSRMAGGSYSAAIQESLHISSFTGMSYSLDPFLNVNTQSFMIDSGVSHTGSSMVGVAGSGINPNLNLIGSVGSNREGRGMFCDSAVAYGSIPRDAFHGSNQHASLDRVDQHTHLQLQAYNSGTVMGVPVNSAIVIGFPAAQPQPAGGIPPQFSGALPEQFPQASQASEGIQFSGALPEPFPQDSQASEGIAPQGNILDLGEDNMLDFTNAVGGGGVVLDDLLVDSPPHVSLPGDGNQEALEWDRQNKLKLIHLSECESVSQAYGS